jgi:hypothetical protein
MTCILRVKLALSAGVCLGEFHLLTGCTVCTLLPCCRGRASCSIRGKAQVTTTRIALQEHDASAAGSEKGPGEKVFDDVGGGLEYPAVHTTGFQSSPAPIC